MQGPLAQLCRRATRPKGAHVLEAPRREAPHVRVGGLQIGRQSVDHLGTPPLLSLAVEHHPTDIPAQPNHRGVGRYDDAQALLADARLDCVADDVVPVWGCSPRRCHQERRSSRFRPRECRSSARTPPASECSSTSRVRLWMSRTAICISGPSRVKREEPTAIHLARSVRRRGFCSVVVTRTDNLAEACTSLVCSGLRPMVVPTDISGLPLCKACQRSNAEYRRRTATDVRHRRSSGAGAWHALAGAHVPYLRLY